MDPCPFVRVVIGSLALKFPIEWKPALSGIHASSSPCYCRIKVKGFPSQFSNIPLLLLETQQIGDQIHACFNWTKSEFDKLVEKSSSSRKPFSLKIEIFTGRRGDPCGFSRGKLLGTVSVPLDVKGTENRGCVIQNGWVGIGGCSKASSAQFHLRVKAEPDPRFVFQFDGEPECSPQVFQVNGNVRQPVFTCNFSFRNTADRDLRSRSSLSEQSTSRSWLSSFTTDKEQAVKERKGWSITVHDLSGSPVAAASMVTPFVPSPGTDRVSRSNPGAWLILRPGHGTWKPWGRLEAWREHGSVERLGCRFDLIPDGSVDVVTLSSSNLSTKRGGKFTIDITSGNSPMTSASSSFDFGSGSGSGSDTGSGSWGHLFYKGFVMSSTVAGDGRYGKPEVEVGVQHVTCTEDAAAFVALAAAVDLSMDACRSFSQKLRKELRQPGQAK